MSNLLDNKNALVLGLTAGAVLTAILGLIFLIVLGNTIDTTNATCHAVHGVNQEITNYFQTTINRIGAPNTPNYGFYKSHPQALVQARQAYDQLISAFQPKPC